MKFPTSDTAIFKIDCLKLRNFGNFYGKCSKISNTFLFLFSNTMLVFRVGNYKILFRIVNREDHDHTSDLGLCCLYRHFGQATSV